MMTNVTLSQQDREHLRRCMSEVLTQITADYLRTQPERRQLASIVLTAQETH
jgi:hypothetical protein